MSTGGRAGNFEQWSGLILSCVVIIDASGCSWVANSRASDQMQQAERSGAAHRPQEELALLQSATRIAPNYVPARERLGVIYRLNGDYSAAAEQYAELARIEPKAADHQFKLGLMDQLIGRLQAAADAYLRSLKLQPKNADAMMNLGVVYLSLGDTDRAVQSLERASELNSQSIDIWSNLGVAYDTAHLPAAAERAYRKALELPGNDRNLLLNYGGNLIEQRRSDDAVRILQSAIDIGDGPLAEKLMGDAFVIKGWTDAAIGRYRRAVSLDPNFVPAYNAMGDVLIRLYLRGMQIDETLREHAVDAWRASLVARPNQPIVEELVAHWSVSR